MHPLTVYEIAVREHQRATVERSRARQVRLSRRARSVPDHRPAERLLSRGTTAVATAGAPTDGRPAVA